MLRARWRQSQVEREQCTRGGARMADLWFALALYSYLLAYITVMAHKNTKTIIGSSQQ